MQLQSDAVNMFFETAIGAVLAAGACIALGASVSVSAGATAGVALLVIISNFFKKASSILA